MGNFIYINEDVKISESITVKNREVGILIEQNEGTSIIQFVNLDDAVEVPTQIITCFDPQETGDQFDYKVCNRCNRLLPVSNFAKNQNGKDNRTVRRPSCEECRIGIDGVSVPKRVKDAWERSKPHMVIWQCPICKKKTIPGLTSKVVLDHNHRTGEPRAWICDSCNTGLGRFKDDVEVMRTAIDYLENEE